MANIKLLKELYKVYAPSGQEKKMQKFICWWIRQNCPSATIESDQIGNLYVTKGISTTYPCVVAHMDQVQRTHSKDFQVLETNDLLFGFSLKHKRQEGLGADDKNGIWVALMCLQKYDTMKTVFFVQEEVGCIGSSHCDIDFFKDCRFVLQCDRRNGSDFITNIGGWTQLCSSEFLQATDYKKFGYREDTGLSTDVGELKENGLEVAAVNLSCGYYEPHTDREFTIISELLNCLALVEHIIENCTEVYPHSPDAYGLGDYGYYYRDEEYDEMFDIVAEALLYNPNLTAEQIMAQYDGMYVYLQKEDFEKMIEEAKAREFMN